MCKILGITDTRKIENISKLIEVSADELKTQRDGFGWCGLTDDFKIFGERTNDVHSFKSALVETPLDLPFIEGGASAQNSFGELKTTSRAFIAHGRISTNNKALVNVHPIVKADHALIHNGVVSHHGAKYEMMTDNDSEHVLQNLLDGGIDSIAQNLTGYYAFMSFTPDGRMIVARDRIANLFVGKIKELDGALIYGTTEDLIKSVVRRMFWTVSPIAKLKDDVFISHDLGAASYTWSSFVSRGRDTYSSSLSQLSLGRSLDDEKTGAATLARALPSSTVERVIKADNDLKKMMLSGEKSKLRQELYKSCDNDHATKKSLKRFFRYIDNTKNSFEAYDKNSKLLKPREFEALSPVEQIECEVFDMVTGMPVNPFNFKEPHLMNFGWGGF